MDHLADWVVRFSHLDNVFQYHVKCFSSIFATILVVRDTMADMTAEMT